MSENAVTTQILQEVQPRAKKKCRRGAPGKGAAQRHNLAHTLPYIESSITKRHRDIRVRCPEGDSDSDGGMCSVSPFLFTCTTGCLAREHQQLLSEEVKAFYQEQGASNRYVEVRSNCNIANKLGENDEKGVFSLQPIPASTRICPYVGEVYTQQPQEGKFVMEVSADLYVDAEHDPYDVGYLYFLDAVVADGLCNPPNYGRYINTIYPEDELTGEYSFNCSFEGDSSGLSVVWVVAAVDIPAGVELLVDYGPAYHARKQVRKRKRSRK